MAQIITPNVQIEGLRGFSRQSGLNDSLGFN